MLADGFDPPYYAVIFSSTRTDGDDQAYAEAAARMEQLAAEQPGFLGIESARDSDDFGITVSYWRDLESIRRWREHAEHAEVQQQGRSGWYNAYRLRVCRVEDDRGWDAYPASQPRGAT